MKRNKLIVFQIVIAFMLICTSVYAATSTIDVSSSKSSIERGETVTVTLSLKDVDSSQKVQSVEGYINYNTDIIEKITVDNIVKNSDNTVTIGNETLPVEDVTNKSIEEISLSDAFVVFNGAPESSNNQAKIVIDFRNGITADTDLLKINFKVKSTATLGDVENAISYSQFVINGKDEEAVSKNLKLTVKAATSNNNNNNDNQNTNNSSNTSRNNNTNSNSNTNRSNNAKSNTNVANNSNRVNNTNSNTNRVTNTNKSTNTKDNTVSGSKLPSTGAKVFVIPASILIALVYVSYKKYMDYKGI